MTWLIHHISHGSVKKLNHYRYYMRFFTVWIELKQLWDLMEKCSSMQDCCLCIRGIVVTIDQPELKTRCAMRESKTGWNSRGQPVLTSVSPCPALKMWGTCGSCSCLCQSHKYLDHDLEGWSLAKQGRLAGAQQHLAAVGPGVYTNF